MATFVTEDSNVEATGRSVRIPPYDVCRVSYYLHCCTLSCGLDIIMDDLVDFRNAHRLPRIRQNAIFELAAGPFKPSEMINVTIFLDEEGELCGNSNNEFYELTTVRHVLNVSDSAIIHGQQTNVSRIMVFTYEWLDIHWRQPMRRRMLTDFRLIV